MNIKQKIMNSPLTKWIYSKIWYFETGNGQIARFVGKGPEIMAGIYLFEKITNQTLHRNFVIIMVITYIITCFIVGFMYKYSGLYNTERYVQTSKDPVTTEILESARLIKQLKKEMKK